MGKISYRVRPETAVLTSGFDPQLSVGSARPPVYRSSTYVFSSPEAAERAFNIVLGRVQPIAEESPDLIYARLNHPNAEILEDQLVPLERGAAAAASSVIRAALDVNLRYLRAAVLRVTRATSEKSDAKVEALSHEAMVASRTVDDAVRHHLSETGTGADLRTPVVRAANRATWIRVAGDKTADISTAPESREYPRACAVLEARVEAITDSLSGGADAAWRPIADEFVRALRADATDDGDAARAAMPLVKVAANLGEIVLAESPASAGAQPNPVTRNPRV